MASLLTLAFLALGFAIGWWIKRRFFAPVYVETEAQRRAREWTAHLDEHAANQEKSLMWTPPPSRREP